ncbi:DUF5008 domain-containing protein [Sphingobacterium sp. SG20118]|uniref:DUF5008 domain-containing protein n=1 Tax=Sphingobacterium TaxID=28453 RepID=UPI0004F7F990|nr:MULTISPECIES: DUF5008 domain-containing protein [Sphingobacterium]AIM38944.1 hypothetical protein KO02_21260 [Sphingobacterium sp. ML3W]MDH5825060.1 DUF5008 domain-containing protein [Sphingobacterium faecium]
MMKYIRNCGLFFFFICLISACNKDDKDFSAPYEEGMPPLDIELNPTDKMKPEFGKPGSEATMRIIGLDQYKDKAIIKFNGEVAEILEMTAEHVKLKVPPYASTGVVSITIDDVVFFGPKFSVLGTVSIDPTFQVGTGANGTVSDMLFLEDGKMIYIGGFTDYNRKGIIRPINRLVRTFPDGTYDASFRIGTGANNFLSSIIRLDNFYYLAGSFSGYDQRKENISNLTRINLTGTIDTMGIKPFRRPDQLDTTKYYPTFNGGFDGFVSNIYESEDKVLATGNFKFYVRRTYDKPNKLETRDTVILDSTEIRHVARLNKNGELDKSFRFKADGKPFSGANGSVGSLFHKTGPLKGKLLVYGSFSKFDDQSKGYITRLNADGTIDPTFNASGVGADYNVISVTFNEQLNKYLIVGAFKKYNGKDAVQVAMLKADGTLDDSFKVKTFEGGNPYFAAQLNDGLIVVSGDFVKYDQVTRSGFMILNPDGALNPDYNTTGLFYGALNKIVETKTEDGKRALLLMGSFDRFNNEEVKNLIRIKLEQ